MNLFHDEDAFDGLPSPNKGLSQSKICSISIEGRAVEEAFAVILGSGVCAIWSDEQSKYELMHMRIGV